MSSSYILYSSEGCHLCEDALALCTPLIDNKSLAIKDIVDDETLVELYGVHIPVLMQVASKKELFWPFSSEDVVAFLT
jgi:hypothetical protein